MIRDLLMENYDSLSKTHKRIANYVLTNPMDTSYLSIKELSERTGAGEATIIRFCTRLGFEGYPEFKNALREDVAQKSNITERLRESYQAYDERETGILQMLQGDMTRIENTMAQMDMQQFMSVCNELILAGHIYILASRSAASLGMFFQYYLNMALGNVELISDGNIRSDCLVDLSSKDVVVGISFSRYARQTVDLFEYAHDKGARTIAITDLPISPLIKYADRYLLAETSMPSYLDSFVAPLSLINAILTEIGRNRNVELEQHIAELDNFYKKQGIF